MREVELASHTAARRATANAATMRLVADKVSNVRRNLGDIRRKAAAEEMDLRIHPHQRKKK